MFIEPHFERNKKTGWIEVICGSMFSGKTEELIRRLRRAIIANQKVEVYKPAVDDRYSQKHLVSHNDSSIRSIPIRNTQSLKDKVGACDVIGIDEVQFFDDAIVEIINDFANDGKRVIVAGLDMDYMGRPFSPMDKIMATAEFVNKLHAVCMRCGSPATYTHRTVKKDKKIVIGEKDIYEALCRSCFVDANSK